MYTIYSNAHTANRKKIIILDSSDSDGFGGGQYYLRRLFLGLINKFDVFLISNNKLQELYLLGEYKCRTDFSIDDFSFSDVDKILVNDLTGVVRNLFLLIKNRNISLPIIHMRLDASSKSNFGRSALKGYLSGMALSFLFRKTLTVSRQNKKFLFGTGEYIGNGIEYRQSISSSVKNIDVIWIGRLSNEKDPIKFLSVCKVLFENKSISKALIVGDGPLADTLVNTINNFGLNNCISYIGWRDSESIFSHLQESKVLMITSLHEGLPTVALEALMSDVKVVITNGSDLDYWDTKWINVSGHSVDMLVYKYIETIELNESIYKQKESLSFDAVVARVSSILDKDN
ncbi:glycosyltransferase [Shewanella glacialipiscicola]|uniref:glycosyltransferase n=1 Tax=Shewanella glacialipiscicola TaxID=614069 RepID=UPI003D7BD668